MRAKWIANLTIRSSSHYWSNIIAVSRKSVSGMLQILNQSHGTRGTSTWFPVKRAIMNVGDTGNVKVSMRTTTHNGTTIKVLKSDLLLPLQTWVANSWKGERKRTAQRKKHTQKKSIPNWWRRECSHSCNEIYFHSHSKRTKKMRMKNVKAWNSKTHRKALLHFQKLADE